GVEADYVIEVGWEALLEFRHRFFDLVSSGQRVRTGSLKNPDEGAGLAVDPRPLLIVERAEFDPGDILEPHGRAVRVRAHNDLAELFRRSKPPLRADGVSHLLSRRRRLGAHLAGGVDR